MRVNRGVVTFTARRKTFTYRDCVSFSLFFIYKFIFGDKCFILLFVKPTKIFYAFHISWKVSIEYI